MSYLSIYILLINPIIVFFLYVFNTISHITVESIKTQAMLDTTQILI